MNASSSFGTFQISTDQVCLHDQSDAPAESNQAAKLATTDGKIRLDMRNHQARSPHIRAAQLNEFVNSLQQSASVSDNAQPMVAAVSPSAPANQPTPNLAPTHPPATLGMHKKKFRVDSPAVATNAMRTTKTKKPHFQTAEYVPNPEDINKTIRELKADGRIIGDHQQLASPEVSKDSPSFNFQWPDVTQRLLGSPALLNLELSVQKFIDRSSNTVVVCSSNQGCGATTLGISLARQLDDHGQRVLLIDGNLTNAVLANRLGIHEYGSWIHSISQRNALSDVLLRDQSSNIDLMPLISMQPVAWQRQVLGQLSGLINSISYDYDLVIVDVGTTKQWVAESNRPQHLGGLTLLVSGNSDSDKVSLAQSKSLLTSASVDNVIIVENFAVANSDQVSKVG